MCYIVDVNKTGSGVMPIKTVEFDLKPGSGVAISLSDEDRKDNFEIMTQSDLESRRRIVAGELWSRWIVKETVVVNTGEGVQTFVIAKGPLKNPLHPDFAKS